MDKALLEELQHIVESDTEQITQKSTNRLLLASMVSVVNTVNQMVTKLDHLTDSLSDQVNAVSNQADECGELFATKDDIRRIEANLAFRAGKFVAEKPRTAAVIFLLLVIITNTWFVSDFRHWVLVLLGLPTSLLQTP